MKHYIVILFGLLLILSCDNTQFPGPPEDDMDEEPEVQLILKELQTTELNQQQRQYVNYFDETGRPTNSDITLIVVNETRSDVELISYNEDGTRDFYNKDNFSFEPNIANYIYENNVLTEVNEIVSGPGGSNFQFVYDNNTIEVFITGDIAAKLVYEFSNNSYTQLESYQMTAPYVDENSNPSYRYEYQYNSDSNISQITKFNFNTDTNQLEIDYLETRTYDNGINPIKLLFDIDPLVVMDDEILKARSYSVYRHNNQYATHNILNRTRTYSNTSEQRITTYVYTYNESNYPLTSNETTVIIDTDTGDSTTNLMQERSYTYYEQ